MKRGRLSQVEKNTMVSMFNSGESVEAISAAMNKTVEVVQKVLGNVNVEKENTNEGQVNPV